MPNSSSANVIGLYPSVPDEPELKAIIPNLGGLLRGPFCGGGNGKITVHCLKLVRIMLETHRYVVLENMPSCTRTFLILLMSAIFCKKISIFLAQIAPLLKVIV